MRRLTTGVMLFILLGNGFGLAATLIMGREYTELTLINAACFGYAANYFLYRSTQKGSND